MLSLYLFWIGLAIVFYTYVGYAFLVSLLARRCRKQGSKQIADHDLPEVTLVIAAYNEEEFISEKIRNTLELDYPKGKLKVFFVTDGSTDGTPGIVGKHSQFTLFHEPERRGKIHAVNRVMKHVATPVTVFCDANTYLNVQAIRCIVRHYADPRIGGVAGEKRIFNKKKEAASASGEGLYWKYESFLKQKDAELHSVVGAAGELFSIRTHLFEPPADDMIIEDFFLSMTITGKGYRFAYEPGAFATEAASVSVGEEWKRKVRICAGAFQAMPRLMYLLNPFRYGVLSLQYFSHRVLRWTLAPLALPIIFFANVHLAANHGVAYRAMLALQILFYVTALAGFILRNAAVKIKGLFVPFYFVVMNAAVFAGFFRYILGKQKVTWEQARRAGLDRE
jgi:cellulose synthase/poly-beta-1,6-N-acetylglucosamine synthase-like glycosyltransferase